METRAEHHDVLIVGAGLSGIGAACQLRAKCPGKTFAILEARAAIGGTWDLFRYPGIRSDSDMYTLGYAFKPWKDAKAIADGPAIREYIRETAREHDVERTIRFHHRVVHAAWSTSDGLWEVEVERVDSGGRLTMTCNFLHVCSGYYDYDAGYTPAFDGVERFRGPVIHPQHWPEDFDYSGSRVLVIGSGATAVTLVPAMAPRASHVTMLQRSPSYVVSLPARDPIADVLRRRLPARTAYALVRWKNVLMATAFFQASRRWPERVRGLIRRATRRAVPSEVDVDTHFSPRYDPWDQRVCFIPDGDLFEALGSGKASIVTAEIDQFTESGVRLTDGRELEADVIVTATGLQIKLLGGITVSVDGRRVDFAQTVAYKGMMFSGVPNLTLALGYTNASWTLKCDLVSDYVCRLLNHMDAHGYRRCMPLEPPPSVAREPLLNLNSGYIMRSLELMPKQGARLPWRLHQNYVLDVRMLRRGPVEDEGIEFSAPVRAIGAPRISSGIPKASTSAAA
jgi:cation diffusion facilitator CzcD-associated flavoprotein CzcO